VFIVEDLAFRNDGWWGMGKNSYNSRSSSSSFMYNDDVRELQCWCPRICVLRKANAVNNPGRPLYVSPLSKVCLTMVM